MEYKSEYKDTEIFIGVEIGFQAYRKNLYQRMRIQQIVESVNELYPNNDFWNKETLQLYLSVATYYPNMDVVTKKYQTEEEEILSKTKEVMKKVKNTEEKNLLMTRIKSKFDEKRIVDHIEKNCSIESRESYEQEFATYNEDDQTGVALEVRRTKEKANAMTAMLLESTTMESKSPNRKSKKIKLINKKLHNTKLDMILKEDGKKLGIKEEIKETMKKIENQIKENHLKKEKETLLTKRRIIRIVEAAQHLYPNNNFLDEENKSLIIDILKYQPEFLEIEKLLDTEIKTVFDEAEQLKREKYELQKYILMNRIEKSFEKRKILDYIEDEFGQEERALATITLFWYDGEDTTIKSKHLKNIELETEKKLTELGILPEEPSSKETVITESKSPKTKKDNK